MHGKHQLGLFRTQRVKPIPKLDVKFDVGQRKIQMTARLNLNAHGLMQDSCTINGEAFILKHPLL